MAITSMAQLRAQYPEMADASDDEVVDAYSSEMGQNADAVRAFLGVNSQRAAVDDNPSDVMNALRTYGNQITGLTAAAGALAADSVGATGARDALLEQYRGDMQDMQAAHRKQYELQYLMSDEASLSDYGAAARYYATLGAANLVGAGGSGYLGRKIVEQGLKRAMVPLATAATARNAGFYGGVAANALGQEIGATYGQAVDEQESRGATADDVDNMRAFLAGSAAGSLEFASDVFLLGAGRWLPKGTAGKLGKLGEYATSGNAGKRFAKGVGAGVLAEGPQEVGQTLLEDYGADTEIDLADVEYRNKLLQAAFAGAAAGGLAQGPVNVLMGDSSKPAPKTPPPVEPPGGKDFNLLDFTDENGVVTDESIAAGLAARTVPAQGLQGFLDATLVAAPTTRNLTEVEQDTPEATGAQRKKNVKAAMREPSGTWHTDPETQVEKELTLGEYYAWLGLQHHKARNPDAPTPHFPVLYEGLKPYVRIVNGDGVVARREIDPNVASYDEMLNIVANQITRRADREATQIENLVDEPDSITPHDTVEKDMLARQDALARKVPNDKSGPITPEQVATQKVASGQDPIFQTEGGRTALNENANGQGLPNGQLRQALHHYRTAPVATLRRSLSNAKTSDWRKALVAEVLKERGQKPEAQQPVATKPTPSDPVEAAVQEAVPVTEEQALSVLNFADQLEGLNEDGARIWNFVKDAVLNDEFESIVSLSGRNSATMFSGAEIAKRLYPDTVKDKKAFEAARKKVNNELKNIQQALQRDMGVNVYDALDKLQSMARRANADANADAETGLPGLVADEGREAEVTGEVLDEQTLAAQEEVEDTVAQEELAPGNGMRVRMDGKGDELGFLDTPDRKKLAGMLKEPAVDARVGEVYETQTGQKDWATMSMSKKIDWFAKFEDEVPAATEDANRSAEDTARAGKARAKHQERLDAFTSWGQGLLGIRIYDRLIEDEPNEAMRVPFSDLEPGYQTLVMAAVENSKPPPKQVRENVELALREIANERRKEAANEAALGRGRTRSDEGAAQGQGQDQPGDAGVSQAETQTAVRQFAEDLAKEGKIKSKKRRVIVPPGGDKPMRATDNVFPGKPEKSVSVQQAKAIVRRVLDKRGIDPWMNIGADVRVVDTFSSLPKKVRRSAAMSPDTLAGVAAPVHDGMATRVYLIADMLADAVDVEELVLHELTHAAVTSYAFFYEGSDSKLAFTASLGLGMSKDTLLKTAKHLGVQGFIDTYTNDYAAAGASYLETRAMLFEEMLAYSIGMQKTGGVWNSILAVVGEFRQWLRRMGFLRTSEIGVTETLALAHRLTRAMSEGMANQKYGFWTSDTGDELADAAFELEFDNFTPLNALAVTGNEDVVQRLLRSDTPTSMIDDIVAAMEHAVATGKYRYEVVDGGVVGLQPVEGAFSSPSVDDRPMAAMGDGRVRSLGEYRDSKDWVDMTGRPMEVEFASPEDKDSLAKEFPGKNIRMMMDGAISNSSDYMQVTYYEDKFSGLYEPVRDEYGRDTGEYQPHVESTEVGRSAIALYQLRTPEGKRIRSHREGGYGRDRPRPMASRRTQRTEETKTMLGALSDKVADTLSDYAPDLVNAYQKAELGFMTLEQIDAFAKRIGETAVSRYVDAVHRIQRTSKDLLAEAHTLNITWSNLRSANPEQMQQLDRLMIDTTLAEFDPSVDTPSTPEQRALAKTWSQLDGPVQELYRTIRDEYAKWHAEKVTVLNDAILAAEAAGNQPGIQRLKRKLESMKKVKGPYFPLKRLGSYYSVGISAELQALMEKNDEAPLTGKDAALMRQYRKDPNHYIVESHESLGAAKRRSAELSDIMGNSYYQEAVDLFKPETTDVPDIATIESYFADSGLDKKARAEVRSILQYMYADLLPADSAAKSQMKREGIAGATEDMQRVFADSAIKNAHQISRLKHAKDVNEALLNVRKMGSRQDTGDVTRIRNEVVARANLVYDDERSPVTDWIMTGSFFAHLGLSPAYVATNMSQVPMITMPWLAARQGAGRTFAAVDKAYSDTLKILKANYYPGGEFNWRAEFDWQGRLPDNEARMLEELKERNKLDITIEHDLTSTAEGASMFAFHRSSDFLQMANLPVRVTELANRAVTALSAYRLESARLSEKGGMSQAAVHEAATQYALDAVTETQLDYSGLNTARYMQKVMGSRNLAKVMFQFRKYQQGMVYLVMKNIKDGLGRAGVSKERQSEAIRTLFGLFVTTGVVGGLSGAPLAGTIAFLANLAADLWDDDDEPFDAELALRGYIAKAAGGGETGADVARAVMNGIPTLVGVDVSKRIGMGDILFPLPFIRDGSTPRETLAEALIASLGAAPSFGINAVEGGATLWDAYTEGDSDKAMKGAAKVIPVKGVQNILKGWNLANQGLTERDGEPVLKPDQIDAYEAILQAAGFSPSKLSDYYEANSRRADIKTAVEDVRGDLMRRYAQARLSGDRSKAAAVRREIFEFNQRNKHRRGVRITGENLQSALRYRQQARKDRADNGLRGGRAYDPYNEDVNFITGAQ